MVGVAAVIIEGKSQARMHICEPIKGRRISLDQEVVPTFLLHRVAPADALEHSLPCIRVVGVPNVLQQFTHPAKGAEVGGFAKALAALSKHGAERRPFHGVGASHEDWPGKGSIESLWTIWDEIHELGKSGDEMAHARLPRLITRNERAQIDACCDSKHRGDIDAELLWTKSACGREAALHRALGGFCSAERIRERFHILAEHQLVELILAGIQTRDLGDEEHDAVITAHQLRQASTAADSVEFTVRVRECWRLTTHSGTQYVNPRSQGHIEWGVGVTAGCEVLHNVREVEFVHQADSRLEMLVPWNIWKRVVGTADRALEEDHPESRLQDLSVI